MSRSNKKMAESVVTFFLQKLSEFITQEANLLTGVDEQICSLRDELQWIRSFLKDADRERKENERVKVWVNQVRDVSHQAEDVIDEFMLKLVLQRQHQKSIGGVYMYRSLAASWFSRTNKLKTLHDLGNQIEKIKRRVEEISANKSKYGIEAIQTQVGESSSRSSNQDPQWKQRRVQVAEEADVVGFDKETQTLVRELIEGDPWLSVISIVGMGGLGKTTLAKKVYNHNLVTKHFDCRALIYVSQEYRVRDILEIILNQITEFSKEDKKLSDEELEKKLILYLKQRRYLVVVDDIWSVEAWDRLEHIFPKEMMGSRILLTTRKKDVARHADVERIPHELQPLTENESWELFCKKTLLRSQTTCVVPSDLEKIGRDMVGKCKGLPLAIVVLGGYLSTRDRSWDEWQKVSNRMAWQLSGNEESPIPKILSLSYNDLPYYLKSCFLYFGVFPEDSEIPVGKLIRLWVAEGFIQQRGDQTLEDVARDYLQELINRSMVQASKRRYNGEAKTCRIHDLLRDLSISEAKEDRFLDVLDEVNFQVSSSTSMRRVTINDMRLLIKFLSQVQPSTPNHLRSLLYISPFNLYKIRDKYQRIHFSSFRLLRVLDLLNVQIDNQAAFKMKIGEMIHLRYLGLLFAKAIKIPSTISNLLNLQTLQMENLSENRFCLPKDINKMVQLRHVSIYRGSISGKIDGLRTLQTLQWVEAGSWIEDDLPKLKNLRKLGIRVIHNSQRETLSNAIAELHQLRSLNLATMEDNTVIPNLMLSNHQHLYKLILYGRLEMLLDPDEFPPYLTHLYLGGSLLEQDPATTLEKLPHLRFLKLYYNAYIGKDMACSRGGFPMLQHLEISGLEELEEWRVEEESMPGLKHLSLVNCKCLQMLPDGLQHLTRLRELEVRRMTIKFTYRIDSENGIDWHKVQHVPSITISDYFLD
uniref:Disease resistance protein RPP8-like n=1 Tax=Nelumbo nucifera TaxID=4432 RepID=A0A822Y3M2_NELNU|nr:TPA_asm: hypothetical protein HUJ06_025681 [Nelumbo nucifera]